MMSREELERITPVSPPSVNRKTKPIAHNAAASNLTTAPWTVASQLKILIPVGTAMIIVADVK